MDKELNELHDLAREMLLDIQRQYEAGTLPPGFGASDKRRVDKAISNLDLNHEAYGDIMDNVLTGNKGPKKLMKDIRGVESRTMAAWQLLNDDTIHHLVQQRTGGNFSKKVSGDVVRGAIKRLEDRFGIKLSQATGPEGVVRGDTALSNFAHKSDDKGTGLERKAIGKNPDSSTTAHRFGNAAYSKTLTDAETANEKALAEALGNLIERQLEDVKVGIATDTPRVEAVRSLDPRLANAYKSTNTVEEISEMKGVLKDIPNIEEQLIETYQVLPEQSKGSVRLNRRQLTMLSTAGVGALSMLGTASSAAETVGRTQIAQETGNPLDYLQAGIAGTSLAADLVPHPAAEIVSTPADLLNIGIDTARDPEPLITAYNKIKKDPLNEAEYLGKQIMGGLKNVAGAVIFGF